MTSDQKAIALSPPLVVLASRGGVGKTTFAASISSGSEVRRHGR